MPTTAQTTRTTTSSTSETTVNSTEASSEETTVTEATTQAQTASGKADLSLGYDVFTVRKQVIIILLTIFQGQIHVHAL